MMSSPSAALISIITPIYNAEKYLAQTIQSVLQQTHSDWELLLILDKNSSDNSATIAEEWARKDPRVRLVSSPPEPGVAANRNRGLQAARGHYVAFLDADDLWHPDKLRLQWEFMHTEQVSFSYCGYEWIDQRGKAWPFQLPAPAALTYSDLLRHSYPIGCLTVMIHRPSYLPLAFPNEGSEDFILWLQLLKQKPQAHGIPAILAQYRILDQSRSRRKGRAANFRWTTLRRIEKISLLPALYYFSSYAFNSITRVMQSRRQRRASM